MKHILILGAGLMQEPAINSAHELGYAVTVFDGNDGAYCKSKCESFFAIDLKNTDELIKKATELHSAKSFAAVFTAGTDFSYAVSKIASALSLPSHSIESAKNASDKIRMRECFDKSNVPSPNFIEVTRKTDTKYIREFVDCITYPVVVKPCDNMGARGCRLVRESCELQNAIDDAITYSKTDRAIIEEYMDGPEFSIDALVFNGEVTITGFADRHIFYPPYFIEMGHSMPTDIDKDNYNKLIQTFVRGIRALGLSHGAAKADIKLTKKGAMIGEIAARLSGGYMSGWTFPYASSLNLTKEALNIALNRMPKKLHQNRVKVFSDYEGFTAVYDYPCNKHCVERAWISIPGTVDSVVFPENINGTDVFPRLEKNDVAVFPVNNVQKAGNVICCKSTRETAGEGAHRFIRKTVVNLKKNDIHTIEFLNQPLSTTFPPSAFLLPIEIYEKIQNDFDVAISTVVEIPDFLKVYEKTKDWNGRTLIETVKCVNEYINENFDRVGRAKKSEGLPSFWSCLIRGGLQGALFYFL